MPISNANAAQAAISKVNAEAGNPRFFRVTRRKAIADFAEMFRGLLDPGTALLLDLHQEVARLPFKAYARFVLALTCGCSLVPTTTAFVGEGDPKGKKFFTPAWMNSLPELTMADAASGLSSFESVLLGAKVDAKAFKKLGYKGLVITPSSWAADVARRSVIDKGRLEAMLTLFGGKLKDYVWEIEFSKNVDRYEVDKITVEIQPSGILVNDVASKRAFFVEGLDGVDGENPYKALYWALWFVLSSGTANVRKGRIAFLTELKRDPGYGEVRNGIAEYRYDYTLGAFAVFANQSSKGGKLDISIGNGVGSQVLRACEALDALDIEFAPSNMGDSVVYGPGARALGVAFDGDLVRLPMAATVELKKMSNRVFLNKATVEYLLMTPGGTGRECSLSPVSTQVGSETIAFYGMAVNAIVAGDCPFLNDGSGMAQLTPGVEILTMRDVTCKTTVVTEGLPADEALNWAVANTKVMDNVEDGDPVFVVDGAFKRLHRNTATLTSMSAPVFKHDNKGGVVQVTTYAVEMNLSKCCKWTKNGVKAIARPNPALRALDEHGNLKHDHEVVLPPEAIKGLWEKYLEMACHWKGVTLVRDPKTPQTPEMVALVDEFLAANTKVVSFLYTMEATKYRRMVADHFGQPGYTFLEGNQLLWTGKVVQGTTWLAVENTPIYLSMGTSFLTPEMQLQQSLVTPKLFEERVKSKAYKDRCYRLQQFMEAVNAKTAPADAEVIDLDDKEFEGYNLLLRQSDQSLMKRLRAKFTKGIVVKFAGQQLYLDLDACAALGPVDADGKGYAYVEEICGFFRFLAQLDTFKGDKGRRIERFINKTRAALAASVADAPKFLAKLLRPTKVQVTKVMTSDACFIGLWEMHVNSNDPRVRKGKWKAGDLVINYRCPVFMGLPYRIVINDDIPVGLVCVNSLCWHATSKGDADGDTVYTESVPNHLWDYVIECYSKAGWLGKDAYFRSQRHQVLV